MYLGLFLLYIGTMLLLAIEWSIVLLPVAVLLIDLGVVRPEERQMESVFGAMYSEYTARVPRWVGR